MSASPHPYSSLIFSNFQILEQSKWFMIYLSRLSQHQSTDLGHEMFVSPGGRTAGPLQRMSCRQAATGRAECCEQLRAVRYPHHSGGACVHSPQSGAGARQRRSCVDRMWHGQHCHTFGIPKLTSLIQKYTSKGLSVLMVDISDIYCYSE